MSTIYGTNLPRWIRQRYGDITFLLLPHDPNTETPDGDTYVDGIRSNDITGGYITWARPNGSNLMVMTDEEVITLVPEPKPIQSFELYPAWLELRDYIKDNKLGLVKDIVAIKLSGTPGAGRSKSFSISSSCAHKRMQNWGFHGEYHDTYGFICWMKHYVIFTICDREDGAQLEHVRRNP